MTTTDPATADRAPTEAQLDLVEAGWHWRPTSPAYHGPAAGYVYPGRRVLDIPGRSWPASTPEECTSTDPGEWITPDVLACTGCGLDCT